MACQGFAGAFDLTHLVAIGFPLIAGGAEVTDMVAGRLRGETPLHFAAARGDRELIAIMLAAGADKGATNARGERPLVNAERANRPEEILCLLL